MSLMCCGTHYRLGAGYRILSKKLFVMISNNQELGISVDLSQPPAYEIVATSATIGEMVNRHGLTDAELSAVITQGVTEETFNERYRREHGGR